MFDNIISRVAIHFVNGDALFFGIAVIVIACIANLAFTKSTFQVFQRISIATAAIIIGLSSTPLPIWFYIVWAIPASAVLFDRKDKPDGPPWRKHGAIVILMVVSLIAALVELPHHMKPSISIDQAKKIIVIGDSISAGIGNESDLWPAILQRELGIEVANLSEPGAKVADAAKTAARLKKNKAHNPMIILEIGGNDILGKTEIDTFEIYLDRILDQASVCSDTVIVLELPLPPFCNKYGTVQRRLTKKHEAHMIPKRYFAGIIGRPGATVDGLHLSPIGHRMFAEMVLGILSISIGNPTIQEQQS